MITSTTGDSFSHQGSSYQVDTRARVIIFDMSALEADNALQQRSSFVPHSADHSHRPLSRELGLMSWPENLYKRMRHKQNPDGIGRQANSLSAKAMQLSIVGSMVCSVHPRSLRVWKVHGSKLGKKRKELFWLRINYIQLLMTLSLSPSLSLRLLNILCSCL